MQSEQTEIQAFGNRKLVEKVKYDRRIKTEIARLKSAPKSELDNATKPKLRKLK